MKILFCNPKNSQGTTHSRKGMYVPLGILSISTVLKERLGDRVDITVYDEDIADADLSSFENFDLVGFYSTTFNYRTCAEYATVAKQCGAKTLLGGPHPTVLAENIMRNRECFDFVVRYEGEVPVLRLVECLLNKDESKLHAVPNLVFKKDGKVISTIPFYEANLKELPIPSREFVGLESYIENFKKIYPNKLSTRPGSIYSSKGCDWRDKTGGCSFCARLQMGVKFRDIRQIWEEIRILRDRHDVNSIWDISDDNLNDRKWFKEFVESVPDDCRRDLENDDLNFFIYSRVNFMLKEGIMDLLKALNVKEVFLGFESGDDTMLKGTLKGQSVNVILRAVKTLESNNIKYFPSFVLGLPGESRQSLDNTLRLCQQLAETGGLDRLGLGILYPIPGSPALRRIMEETEFGKEVAKMDDLDLLHLERFWINNFTEVDHDTVVEYWKKINETMKDVKVFGGRNGCNTPES
jgi:radical SAM superfamily enzyme YgiQ (UPF0313 family)